MIDGVQETTEREERSQLLTPGAPETKPPQAGVKGATKKAPDTLASKLSKPGNFNNVNKAIASHSYNSAPKPSSAAPKARKVKEVPAQSVPEEKGQKPLSGLERIRQLAKQIDSSVNVEK